MDLLEYAIVKKLAGGGSAGGSNEKLKALVDGSITEVKASDLQGVTKIKDSAFQSCDYLTSIEIPDTVEKIGEFAFAYNPNLNNLTIPENVRQIGYGICEGCEGLKKVEINTRPDEVDGSMFTDCYGLLEEDGCIYLDAPETLAYVNGSHFGMLGYNLYINGEPVTTYNGRTYDYFLIGCANVEKAYIDGGVSQAAFKNCTNLSYAQIDCEGAKVQYYAFAGCENLEEVDFVLWGGKTDILNESRYAFQNCVSLKKVSSNEGLRFIGAYCFDNCSALTDIDLSECAYVNEGAFNGCTSLTSLNMPKANYIYRNAFKGCVSLTDVDLGNETDKIMVRAFENCTSLTSLTIRATTPPELSDSAFLGTSTDLTIYVPSESVDVYKSATNWSEYADQIQAIEE